MTSRRDDEAAARAHWLGHLAEALEVAERLTSALARWSADSAEAVLLRNRIKAARAEVEALQGSEPGTGPGTRADELDPLWTVGRDRGPRHDPIP